MIRAVLFVAVATVAVAVVSAQPNAAGAMHARGPVSPFPIDAQRKAAVANPVEAINKLVNLYFSYWNHPGNGHRFGATAAMSLYHALPKIHDLMLNFKELRAHGRLTFDYRGPDAKRQYTDAMNDLYNSVAKFELSEVAGSRKVTADPSVAGAYIVTVDFNSKVTPSAKLPVSVPLPGHAVLQFTPVVGTPGEWLIQTERLTVRLPNPVMSLKDKLLAAKQKKAGL